MVDVIKKMPYENGIVVMTRENYYNVCSEREMVRELLTVRQADYTQPVGWQTIREPWFKLLVVIKKKDYDGCMEYISKRSVPGTRVISTTYELIEILPEGSSKGNALEAMLEIKEINRENLAVIGDFYNDLEMIRMAGVGAAVAGAPDEVLDEADFISGSCKDGAVADLVEYLESICD